MDSADDGTREVPQWWGTGTLRPALPGKISLACMTPQAGRHDSKAEELLKEYLRWAILWCPQQLPVGSSEFVGGTFESFFRQIRSSEFGGRTLKVSSGKLVGSPGDLCGAHEIAYVWDHFVVSANVAGWVERVCWKNFGKFLPANSFERACWKNFESFF